MPGHECYHCKQWVNEGDRHDCWTTTEAALTRELPEDLQDAYARLRETAAELGEQRIYASHKSIMFARKACYFFVRPHKTHLELVVFLGRPLKAPQVRRVEKSSKTKAANFIRITHRDEVEAPITGWLQEAYDYAAPDLKVRPTSSAGRQPDLKVRPTPSAGRQPDVKVRPAPAAKVRPTSGAGRRKSDVGRVFRPGAAKVTARRRSARGR